MAFGPSRLAILACITFAVFALPPSRELQPAQLARRGEGEPYTPNGRDDNPTADEAQRNKIKLRSHGATPFMMAVAMCENGCWFKPKGRIGGERGKSGWDAECSVFRYNWRMITEHCEPFKGQSADQWYNGCSQLADEKNLPLAVNCMRTLLKNFGESDYCGRTRGGESHMGAGVEYCDYIYKYKSFLDSQNGKHLNDSQCIYYNVYSM